MFSSPVLTIHILSGSAGVLSGAAALSLRKGSRWHGLIGSTFVIAMLSLGLTGIEMAVVTSQPGNILGGSLTAYLVSTSCWTARHRQVRIGIFDWVAAIIGAAIAATALTLGIAAARSPTGTVFSYGPGPYILLGTVGLLAALGDIRLLAHRSLPASQRLRRHLWRMCFALFIGTSSIFLARPYLFPSFMSTTGALYVLTFFPLVLMIFWLIRLRFAKAYKNSVPSEAKDGLSIQT